MDLPALGQNATQGQLGEVLVEAAMLRLDQLYERRTGLDFGVDGIIELTTGGGQRQATGRQIGVQVKRGISVVKQTRYGFTHYCTEAHANYWLRHSLPIIVVHSDPTTGRLRWQHVNTGSLRRTGNGYAIDLPPESELTNSLDALRALADSRPLPTASATRTIIIPYHTQHGVRIENAELGIAALEFSRAALRGERCHLVIEVEDEPDLVASIDAIRDIPAPTAVERREAILLEDILHRTRRQACKLQRALALLLTQKELIEAFGYSESLLAEAIQRLVAYQYQFREQGSIPLDAWPTYGIYHPAIRFHVARESMEEFYAQHSVNNVAIRMGDAGGCLVRDLHPDVVATRFLPMLAHRLIDFADSQHLSDEEALGTIGIHPSTWMIGLA